MGADPRTGQRSDISSLPGSVAADTALESVSLIGHDLRLDMITDLAVAAGAGDVGGISLLNHTEIWLPSRIGITESLLPRAGSFCSWVIDNNFAWFEVEDARRVIPFSTNPLVANGGGYAHYAAVSLNARASRLRGTLWIMSRMPRKLTEAQQSKLLALAEVAVDVVELKYCDRVTGLYNRIAFGHHFASLLRNNTGSQIVIGCVDLPAFPALRKDFGDVISDAVLGAVGAFLEIWGAGHVLLGHFCGGQFGFAYVHSGLMSEPRLSDLAINIEQVVCAHINRNRFRVHIGTRRTSLPTDLDAEQLIESATIAATEADADHASCAREFNDELQTRSRLRHQMDEVLQGVAGAGHLVLHYQPKVNIALRTIIGFEALVRWQHPTQGFLEPDQFLPQVEAHGDIFELDMQVVTLACTDLSCWLAAGLRPVPVALNLSRISLRHPDVAERVGGLLRHWNVPGELLEFEVTESAIIEDGRPLLAPVLALRALGARIAVDDFGTGRSNLDALNCFPFDILKIDRQFVHGVASDLKMASLFTHIRGIADIYRAELVCEGVEREEDLHWLSEHGVALVQGWYFSKARSRDDITKMLTNIYREEGVVRNVHQLRDFLH